jgi:P4 family phage/plasmid primase-like protien
MSSQAVAFIETQSEQELNAQGFDCFLDRALYLVALHVDAIPVLPKSKQAFQAGWNRIATENLATIRQWARQFPNHNTGAVANPDKLWLLDGDDPTIPERYEHDTGDTFPLTFTVESSPGHRHYYFRPTAASRQLNNVAQDKVTGNSFSVRAKSEYVVGPGSIHPATGKPYLIVCGDDLVPVPDTLIAWIKTQIEQPEHRHNQTTSRAVAKRKIPEGGGRNCHLASVAGRLHRAGVSSEGLLDELLRRNISDCDPPLPEAEVRAVALSIGRYDQPQSLAVMEHVHEQTEQPTALVHAPATGVPTDPEVLPGIEVRETDLGNALRFVQRCGADVKHCAALGWLVWDGKRWKQQGGESFKVVIEWMKQTIDAIHQEADCALRAGDWLTAMQLEKWALQSQSNSRINAALALAESDRAISVTADALDVHPSLLNLDNGTLDLQTFELRPHRKADNITKISDVEYDPQATHLEFTKFIERILPDEPVRNFVQRWFGYCLTGSAGEQKLVIAHGAGANGKSQLVEVFRKLLGEDYARRSSFDTFRLGGHGETRNDLAALKGKRLITVSESSEDAPLDEAVIKDVTGNEAIAARFLYHEFFEFVPEFKITLSTNHKPNVYGQDYAIWRRLCLVPFEVTIPEGEREADIHKRLLRDESAGILNWALAGLREQQETTLNPPTKVQAATQDYRAEQDIVGQFLEERCEVGVGFEEQSQEVHTAYSQWAEDAGYRPFALRRFNARLVAKGFKDEHNRKGKVWIGLRVKW